MRDRYSSRDTIQIILATILSAALASCTDLGLGAGYIKTHRFVEITSDSSKSTVFQLDVQSFRNALKDPSKVGIKRIGTNNLTGPLLATKDPIKVTQQGTIAQLKQKGISVGPSRLQLRGDVQTFYVDVNVDPILGRGKFHAMIKLKLRVWDTTIKQTIWQETYTGQASASAQSVVDHVYERTLKTAFTSLMTQIQQDDSILDARYAADVMLASTPKPKWTASPRPRPSVPRPKAPQPLQLVILMPAFKSATEQIKTQATTLPIMGLVAGSNDVVKVQVTGAPVNTTAASRAELRQAGLHGKGMKFTSYTFLTKGINRIKIRVEDRQGQRVEKTLTIRKQIIVDNTPPRLVVMEPQLTRAIAVVPTKQSIQRFAGFAADTLSGVSEVRINDDSATITPASTDALQQVGLSGKGVKFVGETELIEGQNQIVIKAIDRRGNEHDQRITLQHQK